MSKEDEKKRRPIIVETGADDPSTVSPPIDVPIDTAAPSGPVDVATQPNAPIPDVKGSDLIVGDPKRPYGSRVSGGMDISTLPPANPNQPPAFQQMPEDLIGGAGQQMPGDATGAPVAPPQAPPAAPVHAPVNIGPVTETERTKVSAMAKEGQGIRLDAAKAAEGIAGREGAANVNTVRAQADLAANEEREREIARRQELEDRAREQAKYQAGLAERDRILNDAEKVSHKDYWSDKPAGARMLSVFSSAVGEYAAVHSGTGHNGAEEFINGEMARDDAKKQGILKQAIYRAGLKGQDAKEAYENGLMEIGLRKAAVLGKLSDHRASVLAAAGVPAAEVEKDKLINAAQAERGNLITGYGNQLNVKVKSSNELQQKYKMESALQAEKIAATAAAGGGQGKGITDARQRAQLAFGIKDQVGVINGLKAQGVKVNNKDLEQFQDNQTYLSAVQHGEKNPMGAAEAILGRKLSLVPRNKFDGIDPAKAEMLGAMDLISQKAALLNAGAMTDEAIRHAREQNDLTTPGIGAKEFERRMRYVQTDLAGVNEGMVPEMVAKARAGAAASDREQAGSAAAQAPTKVERAQLTAWLDKNPNDPRAPGIRRTLGK